MPVNVKISGIHISAKGFTLKNVSCVENLSLHQRVFTNKWKRDSHLKDIPITNILEPPMILIGQENHSKKSFTGSRQFTKKRVLNG